MPFTRHPLDYPINRLLMGVGLWFRSLQPLLPILHTEEEQKAFNEGLAEVFELQKYVDAELLTGWYFYWTDSELRRIHLVPHPRVRRTPGIERIKQLYFGTMERHSPCFLRMKRNWCKKDRERKKLAKLGISNIEEKPP